MSVDWGILLKKSKIERLRKSRESWFLVLSAAARLCRTDTRVYDRFCGNRCGPSHCRARDAPAALKNFIRHPEKTFSTVSTQNGHRCHTRPTSFVRRKAASYHSGRPALRRPLANVARSFARRKGAKTGIC